MQPRVLALLLAAAMCASATPASAQLVVADQDDQKLTIGGYLQAQYARFDGHGDEARDVARFRRMVVSLQGTATRDWLGTIQFDLAPAALGDRVVVKDANLQYRGLRGRGITITIGNQKPPFSRSLLISSARRQIVERTFPGDRSLGSPGRALGVKVDGWNRARTFAWSGELASSLHAPEASQIRVDGLTEAGSDWNEGVLVVGRIELHPLGEMPRDQGALNAGGWRFSTALAAYAWHNDGDRNLYTDQGISTSPAHADASDVRAIELSAGARGRRVSVDAEFEHVTSRAIDPRFSGDLYDAGDAVLAKAGVEAGYMLVPRRLEIVGALDVVNAGTYDRPWQRVAAGLSWYLDAHNLKFQLMHRSSRHDRGVDLARSDATFIQAQIAF